MLYGLHAREAFTFPTDEVTKFCCYVTPRLSIAAKVPRRAALGLTTTAADAPTAWIRKAVTAREHDTPVHVQRVSNHFAYHFQPST